MSLLDTLPKRLAIGPYTFRVVVGTAETHPEQLADNHGLCDLMRQTIHLKSGESEASTLDTTLHEIQHAIHWVQNLTDESTEEDYATRGSTGLVDVLLRNPKLQRWLNKAIREVKAASKRA